MVFFLPHTSGEGRTKIVVHILGMLPVHVGSLRIAVADVHEIAVGRLSCCLSETRRRAIILTLLNHWRDQAKQQEAVCGQSLAVGKPLSRRNVGTGCINQQIKDSSSLAVARYEVNFLAKENSQVTKCLSIKRPAILSTPAGEGRTKIVPPSSGRYLPTPAPPAPQPPTPTRLPPEDLTADQS